MSQNILKQPIIISHDETAEKTQSSWQSYLPFIVVIFSAIALTLVRAKLGGAYFPSDGGLMMLALAMYLTAAIFYLMNFYAPSNIAEKLGMWGAGFGVFFNFASWLFRWVAGYERELDIFLKQGRDLADMPWMFRYVPFANLYDLSLAFAFGAGVATLLVMRREQFRLIAAFSLPLAAIILTLARFIGGEFMDLPPVLDSYWRPIHVGVASLSYGVALVCFAVAVIYLLKDRVKVEGMAIWASVFALSVIATVSKFSVFTEFAYRAGTFINSPMSKKPFSGFFRFEIPYVGPTLVISGLLLVGVIVSFLLYLYQNNEAAKKAGHILLKLALVTQILAIAFLVSGIKSNADIYPQLQSQLASNPGQFAIVGRELNSKQDLSAQEFAALTPAQHEQAGRSFFQQNGSKLFLSLNTNPVEVAGLLTALAGIFFVMMFSFRTEKLIERLPSLDSLDSLMYKTACLAFAGLAMLLITGAIWANESWGRPWGFDSKETGALVAWLTYAAFLHTRISRGWKGRSSAYFAILGFLLVIFTYLGVSYLLPGLHSYA